MIRQAHLHAALAVWDHAQASAKRIFGDVLGLPLADRIVGLLRAKGPMTTTDIHHALQRHANGADLQAALNTLESKSKIRKITTPTKGRPVVPLTRPSRTWGPFLYGRCELSAKKAPCRGRPPFLT